MPAISSRMTAAAGPATNGRGCATGSWQTGSWSGRSWAWAGWTGDPWH
jgi:hypothetical protein